MAKRMWDEKEIIQIAEEHGGEGGGAVQSVNNKTGKVVLKAEDIKANNTATIQANLERIDGEINRVESRFDSYVTLSELDEKGYMDEDSVEAKVESYHDESKQDRLTAGANITIVGNVISATGGSEGGVSKEYVDQEVARVEAEIPSVEGLAKDSDLKAHTDNGTIHVTASDKVAWSQKVSQDQIEDMATKTYMGNYVAEQIANKQDKLESYSDHASVSDNTLTINYKVRQEDGSYSDVPVEFTAEGGGSVNIDNKTIVEDEDGNIKTALGGYIEKVSSSKDLGSLDFYWEGTGAYPEFRPNEYPNISVDIITFISSLNDSASVGERDTWTVYINGTRATDLTMLSASSTTGRLMGSIVINGSTYTFDWRADISRSYYNYFSLKDSNQATVSAGLDSVSMEVKSEVREEIVHPIDSKFLGNTLKIVDPNLIGAKVIVSTSDTDRLWAIPKHEMYMTTHEQGGAIRAIYADGEIDDYRDCMYIFPADNGNDRQGIETVATREWVQAQGGGGEGEKTRIYNHNIRITGTLNGLTGALGADTNPFTIALTVVDTCRDEYEDEDYFARNYLLPRGC